MVRSVCRQIFTCVYSNGGFAKMKSRIAAFCSGVVFVLALVAVAHAQAPAKVAGTRTMTNMGRNGDVMTTLTLTQDGSTLKGSMKAAAGMETPLDDGSMIMGNAITLKVTRMGRNGAVMVTYTGT